jgi:predicted YcjX-like family ATPase
MAPASKPISALSFWDEVRLGQRNVADYAASAITPVFRLGVTGLSRSGKTVFITALVNALLRGGRLPMFEPMASGRITRAYIDIQPEDTCPRFAFERHEEALKQDPPSWPQSTNQISQLRITLELEPNKSWGPFARRKLHLDIIDYPGEWLLDLPLLNMEFADWCAQTWARANAASQTEISAQWRDLAHKQNPQAPFTESTASELAEAFTRYLHAGRDARHALSTLPPGRFLMPGDMAGSPALTFSPLPPLADDQIAPKGSLWQEMARRYNAYRTQVAKPFFMDQFARLDGQVVLVDMLSALNAGTEAIDDLEQALTSILKCFNVGPQSWYSLPFTRKINRVVFAATKADHLHARQHQNYEKLLQEMVARTVTATPDAGVVFSFTALSSLRATRQGEAKQDGVKLPCVIGSPAKGEVFQGTEFDGNTEIALFPGDLPDSLKDSKGNWRQFKGLRIDSASTDYAFLRFAPPKLNADEPWPHVRLDRVLEAALGKALGK